MEQFKKLISSSLIVLMALVTTGVGYAEHAFAAQLTAATATLDDPTSGASTNYTVQFTVATTGNIGQIDFLFANSASSGTTEPTGMSTGASTLTSVSLNGSADSGWTLGHATPGLLKLTRTASSYTAAGVLKFVFGGIANNTTTGGSQCDAVTDSDSCFIRIYTYAVDDTGGTSTAVDTTTITYTVVNPVTVTATVDPILIFTLSGVNQANVLTNDSKADLVSPVGSTVTSTSTTIPFLHITVGNRVEGQQKLTVETNANNGYTVYNRFTTASSAQYLIGSANSSNHFSPFTEGTANWASPKIWADPTGTTANTNTAEIGVRTTDTAISGGAFNTNDFYGPPTNTVNGVPVKTSAGPDNGGSGTDKYVTFKVEANAFQPADSYTGTMVYEVVASY